MAINRSASNLYAIDETTTGGVGAYAIDKSTGSLTFINSMPAGGAGPAFVALDHTGQFVFVANYDAATIAVLPVQSGGAVGSPVTMLTTGAAPHSMVADRT